MVRFIFTNYERGVLLKLIVQHHAVLGCKENSGGKGKAKLEAWADITEKFNATEGVRPCKFKQLKKCWNNIRSRAKLKNESVNISDEDFSHLQNGTGTERCESTLSEGKAEIKRESNRSLNIKETSQGYEQPLSLIVPRKRTYMPAKLSGSDDPDAKHLKASAAKKTEADRTHDNALLKSMPQTQNAKTLEIEMRKKEHEAKMEKLRLEQDFMSVEHAARMELVKAQTEYYKEKLKQLNGSWAT